MKGIVFTHYLDFVEASYDYSTVDKVLSSTTLSSNGIFTSVGTYPHTDMVALLMKTSELKGVPAFDLLRGYGKYLAGVFYKSFPVFFEQSSDAFSFLASVHDKIHPEVKKLYPDSELPHFDVMEYTETKLVFIYRSSRSMADFAHGLIDGCLQHYGESAHVIKENIKEDGSEVKFVLIRA